MENLSAYRLIKNGNTWDYSTHPSDIVHWGKKILREEPEAVLEVEETTREEMMAWREGW
jgi:hypothetical protein